MKNDSYFYNILGWNVFGGFYKYFWTRLENKSYFWYLFLGSSILIQISIVINIYIAFRNCHSFRGVRWSSSRLLDLWCGQVFMWCWKDDWAQAICFLENLLELYKSHFHFGKKSASLICNRYFRSTIILRLYSCFHYMEAKILNIQDGL